MIIVEQQDMDGTEWLVSFTSHNPAEDECVVVKDHENAKRLVRLVEEEIAST